jgi:hypothetical protein
MGLEEFIERSLVKLTKNLKMAAIWDIATCSLVQVHRLFRGAYCLHHRPDDVGSKHLWNVGKLQQDYTEQYPRRLPLKWILKE